MLIGENSGVNLLTPINSIEDVNEGDLVYVERETCDDILIELCYLSEGIFYSKNGKRKIKDYICIYKRK